jgi:hypothetical protein
MLLYAVCPYVCLDLYNYPTDFNAVFLKIEIFKRKVYVYILCIYSKEPLQYQHCTRAKPRGA